MDPLSKSPLSSSPMIKEETCNLATALPAELICYILSFLSKEECHQSRLISRSFCQVAQEPSLYKESRLYLKRVYQGVSSQGTENEGRQKSLSSPLLTALRQIPSLHFIKTLDATHLYDGEFQQIVASLSGITWPFIEELHLDMQFLPSGLPLKKENLEKLLSSLPNVKKIVKKSPFKEDSFPLTSALWPFNPLKPLMQHCSQLIELDLGCYEDEILQRENSSEAWDGEQWLSERISPFPHLRDLILTVENIKPLSLIFRQIDHHFPQLESLTLHALDFHGEEIGVKDIVEGQKKSHFYRLKTLGLSKSTPYRAGDPLFIQQLLKQCLHLETLSLEMPATVDDGRLIWTLDLLKQTKPLLQVKNLSLLEFEEESELSSYPVENSLKEVYALFPHLEQLTLQVASTFDWRLKAKNHFKRLEKLSFRGCLALADFALFSDSFPALISFDLNLYHISGRDLPAVTFPKVEHLAFDAPDESDFNFFLLAALFPNLKELTLSDHLTDYSAADSSIDLQPLFPHLQKLTVKEEIDLEALLSLMQTSPQLKQVIFDDLKIADSHLFLGQATPCLQVKEVVVRFKLLNSEELISLFPTLFPNLERLQLIDLIDETLLIKHFSQNTYPHLHTLILPEYVQEKNWRRLKEKCPELQQIIPSLPRW